MVIRLVVGRLLGYKSPPLTGTPVTTGIMGRGEGAKVECGFRSCHGCFWVGRRDMSACFFCW